MPSVDVARWTTTLTASYLAITASLIAILGSALPEPFRAGRVAPDTFRLVADPEPRKAAGGDPSRDSRLASVTAVSFPLQRSGTAGAGSWRLAVDCGDSGLGVGAVRRAAEPLLSERLAFVPLSEYLHFCYLSYVIVIPSVAAYWYVSGRRAAFGELLLLLSTVLLASYLFFILLPVDSPYYLSQRLGPPLSGHFFFDLVHQVSARGGARGGAFPSAHVSGAVVVSLVAWRHQRGLAYLLVPFTWSVMIATVYGRFHYVLDTLAGAALAIAVVVAYRYLSGDGPRT